MNICKKCGRQLNKNALFCPKCGTKTEPPLSLIKKVSKSSLSVMKKVSKSSLSVMQKVFKVISKIFIKHKKKIKFSTILVISGIFLYYGSNFAIKYYYRSLSDFTNSIGTKFILVKQGSFQMGDDTDSYNDNTVHTVNITKDFYVGKYEVTNSEVVEVYNWAKANNISGLEFTSSSVKYNSEELLDLDNSDCEIGYRNGSLYVKNNKDKYPCIYITWYGAEAFCKFLNKQNRTDKYRLLTEAEWEYASRGGNKSKGYKYSGSNSIGDVAWYDDNSGEKTHKVGLKKPNELGIYDMSGNVWEWVQDRYDENYYSKSPMNNPLNSSGSYCVLRGGSWYINSFNCRVAYRSSDSPDVSDFNFGFRFAKTL